MKCGFHEGKSSYLVIIIGYIDNDSWVGRLMNEFDKIPWNVKDC